MLLGAALLGLHMGATHGVSLAMLASCESSGESLQSWLARLPARLAGDRLEQLAGLGRQSPVAAQQGWLNPAQESSSPSCAPHPRPAPADIPATVPGLGRISGTAWSLTDLLLGLVLAASNLMAGRLADATAQRGLGNIGCFLGGGAASVAAMAALVAFSTWGELGREEAQAGAAAAAKAA